MNTVYRYFLCLCGLLAWGAANAAEPPEVKSPLSPEESLKHFQLDPLLSIELVAAEPEVVDPVAIRFDEDGRLWVAEMRDYPLGPIKKTDKTRTEKDAEPLSQIKILEDKNGDGRFETATVFADKLLFVTGLQPWKGGVIVTLSGKVAYMKDTDGDGKADVNETWFTGFSESNSQLRANHPTFALDNHIYVANGLRGGMVVNHLKKLRGQRAEDRGQEGKASGGRKPPDTKESGVGFQPAQKSDDFPINISGMDFRFDPLTGDAEAVSGNGQFGLCFDDWGNRFVCSNRNPCQHVVIENRYLKKAPTVAIPSVVQDVAAFAENSRIYPISKFWTTSNLHEGQFTAACGVFIYRGDLLPQQFRGNVFTCDPTGNLIHREIMEAKGPTFTSKPAYEGKEFLASPDTWFRPVSMELGPDGALYVVDMYRAVIEHPEWVPDELKNRPDERLGDDRGRIYRIVRKGYKTAASPVPKQLSKSKSDELVAGIESENAWKRETVQRLLIERQDPQIRLALTTPLKRASPVAQAQTLRTLSGLGVLDRKELETALDAKDWRVRASAIAVAEREPVEWLKPMDDRFRQLVIQDESLEIRLLAAWLTQSPPDAEMESSLSGAAIAQADDSWMRRLFLLVTSRSDSTRLLTLKNLDHNTPSQRIFLQEIVSAEVADGSAGQGAVLLDRFLPKDQESPQLSPKQALGLITLGLALDRKKASFSDAAKSFDLKMRLVLAHIAVDRVIEDDTLSDDFRVNIIGLAVRLPDYGNEDLFMRLATAGKSSQVRQAAVMSLSRQEALAPWTVLIERMSVEPAALRQSILEGILQRPERISLLLDSLESGAIKPTDLDPVQTGRLLKHGDAKIRQRAEKIFGSATPADRKKALEDYQSVLTMTGDAKRGQVSFAKNCATCHKIGETGVNVAPDISDSRTKTPAQILADIIQPNRAIDANYVAYNLLLADGTAAAGILTSETSTSITLKAAGAKVITVARGEIEQLKSTGVSLMPEGLEKTIPPQEMADLIAFIKNWRYLDGRVPVK